MLINIWLVVSNPLKNMKANWDDNSKLNGQKHMFQTTNQNISLISDEYLINI